MFKPVNQYQSIQVTTSNPEKILIMLYDGAINFTKIAIDKVGKGDRGGKGVYISKTQAILGELMMTLNHEIGGEVAKQLERLYIYLTNELTAANINNNAKPLHNAVRILTIMRDTWVEAIDVAKKERGGMDMRNAGGLR
jgi:flagellar protein FliS